MCKKETEKMIQCEIRGDICLKCCFHISSGDPESLKKVKIDNKLSKEQVLEKCLKCAVDKKIQK
ncbi:MAG: hypothetical protein JW803_02480 [Endomicrobiales bacterium]|nr:hypothetical protein [Endomicrobiales bacterium]